MWTDDLTLAWIERKGWVGDLAERRIGRRFKRDFLGFADVVAVTPEGRAVAVQQTDASHFAARRRKVLDSPEACLWAMNGGRVVVLGWRKDGRVRVEELSPALRGE